MDDNKTSNTRINFERLIAISLDLASTLDLDSLLRRILKVAAEMSQAEQASILLYDEKKKSLYFQAATNAHDEKVLSGIIVPAESIAGWVAANHQPVIVPDVHQDTRWFHDVETALAFQTRSLIAVPLIAKEKLIGVLEVVNKLSGVFTTDDQEILMVLGANAAIAIENAHLFQQSDLISELVHELRTPLTSIATIAQLLQRAAQIRAARDRGNWSPAQKAAGFL